jgi:crotonobetainyl-CoA:carnitine CoA-transferase CaiB-like acyl-CoA transferase
MTGPLDGMIVADFSRVLSGPWCSMTLGDLGADIIKVERPGSGDETRGWGPPFVGEESAYFLSANRNKRSLRLDLGSDDDRAIAERLVARADVVLENFRPGTMDRLGLGEGRCRELNPTVVYASITGFGPDSRRPGYDAIVQAVGGVMSITGPADGEPVKIGVAIADISAGLYSAIGILGALVHRARTGEGQRVDATLLGAQVAWLANQASNTLNAGFVPGRLGTGHPSIVPYQAFNTSDAPLMLAVANEAIWQRFCGAIGDPGLATDARFAGNVDRVANRDALVAGLSERFATATRATWLERLDAADVPAGAINALDEVFADEAVRALDLVARSQHPTIGEVASVRFPVELSRTPASVRRAPPQLGEHDAELLTWLGCSDEEIAAHRARIATG